MDELITELPFKDIVEIPHLDDNHNSSYNNILECLPIIIS